MASGCIIGTCALCKEFVWEDEDWDFVNDNINNVYHLECIPPNLKDIKTMIAIYKKELEKHPLKKMKKNI